MMEPVAYKWEEYFTEWGKDANGEYKHSTMWDDEKPADHPDIRDVTPLVRLSDAEARIAELERKAAMLEASAGFAIDDVNRAIARAEAAEALLKEQEAKIERLMLFGGRMANACYNIGQKTNVSPSDRRDLHFAQLEWDAAARALKEKP